MNKAEKLRTIHQKKLGILIQNAREAKNRTVETCASLLQVTPETFLEFENGTISPTFPQVEHLSFFLGIPMEHFWASTLIDQSSNELSSADFETLMKIRNRILAIQIRSKRESKNITADAFAESLSLSASDYASIENGTKEIGLPLLEQIAFQLEMNLKEFITTQGKIGHWNKDKRNSEAVRNLPPDVISFITNPSNEPYLRLAMHLSGMSADRLRSIAEGLLEITF